MRRWLTSTHSFQAEAFLVDASALSGEALADYIQYNLAALFVETGELASEVGWKPWDTRRGWVNKKRVTEEGVDVLMFLGNILAAAGVTDRDIRRELKRKRRVVRKRLASKTYTSDRSTSIGTERARKP